MARTADPVKNVRLPSISVSPDVAEKLTEYRFAKRYDRLQDLLKAIVTDFIDGLPDVPASEK